MGIESGAGTFYFLGDEGVYIPVDIPEYADEEFPLTTSAIDHLTESLEITTRICFESMITLLGLRKVILDLCPDKQVVHLTNHAAKKRTRKKNFRRAIRILEV